MGPQGKGMIAARVHAQVAPGTGANKTLDPQVDRPFNDPPWHVCAAEIGCPLLHMVVAFGVWGYLIAH